MKKREWAPGVYENFVESYDYTTCQRADGSYYGTGGTCRKGTEVKGGVPKKEKKKDESGGGAEGKRGFERGGTGPSDISNLGGNNSYGKNVPIYETQIKKAEEALKKDPKDESAQYMLDNAKSKLVKYENSKAVLDGVVANSPKGTEVTIAQNGAIRTSFTTPNGNKVTTDFHRGSFNFQVNDTYDAGTVKQGRAEEMAIARQVQRTWNAHKDSLPQNFVVGTSAWTEDGKGMSRARAYERMGFSKPAYVSRPAPGRLDLGSQYARKDGNKMVPSNSVEEGQGNALLMFAEKISDEMNWHQAIFGRG